MGGMYDERSTHATGLFVIFATLSNCLLFITTALFLKMDIHLKY